MIGIALGNVLLAACGVDRGDRSLAVPPHIRVYIPQETGPFPTIVAVPGCSGVSYEPATDAGGGFDADPEFRRHYPRMAERLRSKGFLVLLVDYLTAHGVVNACRGELTFSEVGEYVFAAARIARRHPQSDRADPFLLGWSRGGGGVLAALAEGSSGESSYRGTIAVYPGCEELQPWDSEQRVLLLLAEEDDIAPPDVCRDVVARLRDDQNVVVHGFSNARHGFDVQELPVLMDLGGGLTLGYDSVAARRAWQLIDEFLAQ